MKSKKIIYLKPKMHCFRSDKKMEWILYYMTSEEKSDISTIIRKALLEYYNNHYRVVIPRNARNKNKT